MLTDANNTIVIYYNKAPMINNTGRDPLYEDIYIKEFLLWETK